MTMSTLLWLAAGAHGAPCVVTPHCALDMACEPETKVCMNAPRVEVAMVDVNLCGPNHWTEVVYEATNVGEVTAVEEKLTLSAILNVNYVDAVCEPDGSGTFNGWSWEIFDSNAYRHWAETDDQTATIAPGETVEVTALLGTFPHPYTYNVDLDLRLSSESGGYDFDQRNWSVPKAPYLDLTEYCAPRDAICSSGSGI